jgi:hypothetical protein
MRPAISRINFEPAFCRAVVSWRSPLRCDVRDSALSSPVASRFFKLPLDGKHGSADLLISLSSGAVLFSLRPYLPGDTCRPDRCGYRQGAGDAAAALKFATVRLLM